MTKDELERYLCEQGHEDTVLFKDPDYAEAFIGVTTEGRAAYSFEKMAQCLMEKDGMSYEDAVEFIEYNSIRALPYAGPLGPVVIYDCCEE